jgi:hypothetical protein
MPASVRWQGAGQLARDSDTDAATGKNRGLTPFAALANGCLYPVFAAFDAHCLNRRCGKGNSGTGHESRKGGEIRASPRITRVAPDEMVTFSRQATNFATAAKFAPVAELRELGSWPW